MKIKFTLFTLLLSVTAFCQVAGSLDTSFGTNGSAIIDFTGTTNKATGIALQSDGKILVCGSGYYNSQYDFYVVRYNSDGTLDNTFGANGVTRFDSLNSYDTANAIAIQSDGKIIIAGSVGTTTSVAVVRFNSDGTVDTTFGTNGKFIYAPAGLSACAYAIALQPDGKIILGGSTNHKYMLMRLLTDGTRDLTFDTDGFVNLTVTNSSDPAIACLGIQADGKIVCGGVTLSALAPAGNVVRFNTNGSLDTTFATSGVRPYSFTNINDLQVLSDGKILVSGSDVSQTPQTMFLGKLNSDGSTDTTFGTSGSVRTSILPNLNSGYGMAVQLDGKIILAGSTNGGSGERTALVRFDANGSLDTTFGNYLPGKTINSFGINDSSWKRTLLQPDGKILVTGLVSSTGTGTDFLTARYLGTAALGISDINETGKYLIWPNPVQDRINISGIAETASYRIINMLGEEIAKGTITENMISISNIKTGCYFLQITENDKTSIKRFIKE